MVVAGPSDGTPILGDKRNDENKIVSQFHGALIRFHNKVVKDDALILSFGGDPSVPSSRFARPRTWCVGTINTSSCSIIWRASVSRGPYPRS